MAKRRRSHPPLPHAILLLPSRPTRPNMMSGRVGRVGRVGSRIKKGLKHVLSAIIK